MTRSQSLAGFSASFMIALSTVAAARAGPPGLGLSWYTVDGGGGIFSAGGGFVLGGTIGQPDAGAPMTGGNFELTGGFWPGAGQVAETCPGDITPDGGDGVVDVTDLLALLGAWGPCPAPPASCPADIDESGDVGVTDLLAVLGAWGLCP